MRVIGSKVRGTRKRRGHHPLNGWEAIHAVLSDVIRNRVTLVHQKVEQNGTHPFPAKRGKTEKSYLLFKEVMVLFNLPKKVHEGNYQHVN